MDGTKIFFADTYALIEILNGTLSYKKYKNSILITSKINLAELYYHLLLSENEKIADKYYDFFKKIVVPISSWSIKTGMKFKQMYKKEKLSYADCIGYALALELNVPFLTGDKEFKNKFNVEFVK
jgi:predicted nucleic acid-binding protein